jgi:hypothetical protein
MKSEMIMEGYKHASSDVARIAKDLKVLNTWIEAMPKLIEQEKAEGIDIKLLTVCLQNYALNVDFLTEQFAINSERVTHLISYLAKKQTV